MSLDVRISQLEEQVRLLAAGLNIKVGDPAAVIPRDVIVAARTQKAPAAVKLLRSSTIPAELTERRKSFLGQLVKPTGLTLLEAVRIVDAAALSDPAA